MSKYLDETGVKYLWQKTNAKIEHELSEIKREFGSVYEWKGSVDTLADLKALPEETLKIGDVYDVKESGMNYGWTGDKDSDKYDDGWDPLGSLVKIPTLSVEDIDRILSED